MPISTVIGMQRSDEPIRAVLVRHDTPMAKHCELTLEGSRLTRATWTGEGKPRVTVREVPGLEGDAYNVYLGEVRKKMREGFAFIRAAESATLGDLLLECVAPNRSASRAFDLRPDGAELAVGTVLKDGYGAEIHLIDVATGVRRLVHTEEAEESDGRRRQTIVHAVLYDATGTALIYSLNEETRRLDLRTGETRVLAEYRQWKTSHFNPYCVRPAWDAARRRLVVFDSGDMVRVLDARGERLFELCTTSKTTECRAAALSASGRLLALYRPSRGIIPKHADALHDTTNEIEVWDVDEGTLRTRVPVPAPLHADGLDEIGFDPTETVIVTNPQPVQGPCGISTETGEIVWAFAHAHRTDRWDVCFGWAYSPDGSLLAIGRRDRGKGVDLRDAATRGSLPLERVEGHRVYRLAFSADGTLLAAGGDTDLLTVRKVADPGT